jgi:hypothetical protein
MTGLSDNFEDYCGGMIAAGMPGCMPPSDHETIAETAISATGQYLRPMLERASVKPVVVETTPKRPKRSRKVDTSDEDEADLIAAK